LRALVVLALCAFIAAAQAEERTLELADGRTLRYSVLAPGQPMPASARGTATRLLGFLAAGDLEEAATLSSAPKRRFEVLRDYRAAVGEAEFKRIFSRFLEPENPVLAEIAMDKHRLIIWDLGEARHQLAAQYYVEVEGRFLMDDVPSQARSDLRRILQAYRNEKSAKPSTRTD
jgi:hypothetical protein